MEKLPPELVREIDAHTDKPSRFPETSKRINYALTDERQRQKNGNLLLEFEALINKHASKLADNLHSRGPVSNALLNHMFEKLLQVISIHRTLKTSYFHDDVYSFTYKTYVDAKAELTSRDVFETDYDTLLQNVGKLLLHSLYKLKLINREGDGRLVVDLKVAEPQKENMDALAKAMITQLNVNKGTQICSVAKLSRHVNKYWKAPHLRNNADPLYIDHKVLVVRPSALHAGTESIRAAVWNRNQYCIGCARLFSRNIGAPADPQKPHLWYIPKSMFKRATFRYADKPADFDFKEWTLESPALLELTQAVLMLITSVTLPTPELPQQEVFLSTNFL